MNNKIKKMSFFTLNFSLYRFFTHKIDFFIHVLLRI
jgi:hypothetical protein